MIYKNCIDICHDCVAACDRCFFEGERTAEMDICATCADVCNLVARLTAKNLCCKEVYEFCAKICDECAMHCNKMEGEHAKVCAEACKKCAEACRKCYGDCKDIKTCCK